MMANQTLKLFPCLLPETAVALAEVTRTKVGSGTTAREAILNTHPRPVGGLIMLKLVMTSVLHSNSKSVKPTCLHAIKVICIAKTRVARNMNTKSAVAAFVLIGIEVSGWNPAKTTSP
jgi:hypothetical protein